MNKSEFESLVKGDRVELESGKTGTIGEERANGQKLVELDKITCHGCSPYYNASEIKKKL